jgi:flagellar hook-associated protein 1 FlgK
VAIGLARVFNEQHQKGMDLDGDLGQAFFTEPTATVLPDTGNASTLNVTIADVSRLTTDDYELRFDGTNWNLTRQSDGQPVAMTGTGTAADPFLVDGLAMEVGGAPAAGDVYVIRPTRAGARQIDTLLTNVRDIAAAYPVQGQADIGNAGSATIDGFEILDATDPNLRTAVTLTYDAGTGEFSDGTNTYPYTSGGNIDINGWRARITGTPQDGDVFTFTDNTGGVGDNRNALALVALQNTNTLGAGATGTPSASFGEAYNELVSDVGTKTRSAEIASNAQKGLLDQAQSRREAVSGVNLDEEAANLLRFQQAYQAAAQIISIANQNFQTLIAAVGR